MSSVYHQSPSNEDDITPELLRPVAINNQLVPNRQYYPLRHHQEDFDNMESRGFSSKYTLNLLKDAGNDPPPHNLCVVLKCAILGSPLQRLTLREIRIAMCRRFAYFTPNNAGWCNTIRHILSTKRDEFELKSRSKTSDDSGGWWKVISGAEPREEELIPGPSKPRRTPPAAGSSNRHGLPSQSRQRKFEPWMEMTTSFATSEDEDREMLYAQYAQGGHGAVNQHPSEPQIPSTGSSTAQLSYQGPPAAFINSVSREPLPDIRSLGLLELGTRYLGGGQSYQNPQAHPSDRGIYESEEYEYYYGEE